MAFTERVVSRLAGLLMLMAALATGGNRGGLPGVASTAGLSGTYADKVFHGCTNNGETPMYDVIVHWDGAVGHFLLHNLTRADITFDFNLDLEHLEAAAPLPRRVVVGPLQTREAVTVRRMTAQGWSYRYSISCTFGRPDTPPDNYAYRLPYADGATYQVVQGYGGSFSHHDDDSWYSLDFDMPEGTPVLAVRDGVVALVVNNYTRGGASEEYRNKANLVQL
ncbi:MAG: hypothetical protein ACYCW6_06630, partial [Candidatus Xenobia bacterium]